MELPIDSKPAFFSISDQLRLYSSHGKAKSERESFGWVNLWSRGPPRETVKIMANTWKAFQTALTARLLLIYLVAALDGVLLTLSSRKLICSSSLVHLVPSA